MPRIYRKKKSTGMKKKTALATKAFVQKAIKGSQETKYNDSFRIEQTSSTVGVPYYQDDFMTVSVAQNGNGQGFLIGNRAKNIGMMFKWIVNNNSTAVGMFARVLILTNRLGRTNTDYRNGTGIFEVDGQNQNTSGTLHDMQYNISKEQYIVHYDKVFKLGTSSQDASNFLHGQHYLPMKGVAKYDITTGSFIEPLVNNKVLLIIVAEAPNDGSIGVTAECTTQGRYYYKDA